MLKDYTNRRDVLLFYTKWSCFFFFISFGWQHLFWETPYRVLFWDEALLSPIVEFFGSNWQAYLNASLTNALLSFIPNALGLFYICFSLYLIIHREKNKRFKFTLRLIILQVALYFFISWKDHAYQIGYLIEHSLQLSLPYIYFRLNYPGKSTFSTLFLIRLLIALTFIGHGLYAIGFYPVPGHFIEMVINIFSKSESWSREFLYYAGIMDFIAAAGIMLPYLRKYFLAYMAFWGLVTGLARIVSNVSLNNFIQDFDQWWYQSAIRFVHGISPLMLLHFYMRQKSPKKQERPLPSSTEDNIESNI